MIKCRLLADSLSSYQLGKPLSLHPKQWLILFSVFTIKFEEEVKEEEILFPSRKLYYTYTALNHSHITFFLRLSSTIYLFRGRLSQN